MKYGTTKWCYKCGGTKMQDGGRMSSWPNTIGIGRFVKQRNLDQLPFFRMGGALKRMQLAGSFFPPSVQEDIPLPQEEIDRQRRVQEYKSEWQRMNPGMIYENRKGTQEAIAPNVDPNYQTQTSFDNSTLSLRAKGRRFDNNANLIPNRPNYMGMANAINYGVAGLSELAGMYDRNMQQQYLNRMQNNPLSGILPFDDGRSKLVKEGYNIMEKGGLFANYWAKRRRGEAAGTRKPNESSASKEEWERSARTAKKKEGGININPENRGKFTAWAKQRGMSVSEAANKVMSNTEEYSPSVVKMANFAKNARKWN